MLRLGKVARQELLDLVQHQRMGLDIDTESPSRLIIVVVVLVIVAAGHGNVGERGRPGLRVARIFPLVAFHAAIHRSVEMVAERLDLAQACQHGMTARNIVLP